MAYYRLYLLAPDGRIVGVRECHLDSDEAAITTAIALDHPHGIAVWPQQRYLGKVNSSGATLR